MRLDLNAHLLTPVQRILRYKMLLTELHKYTPDDHTDAAEVQWVGGGGVQGAGAAVATLVSRSCTPGADTNSVVTSTCTGVGRQLYATLLQWSGSHVCCFPSWPSADHCNAVPLFPIIMSD